MLTVPVAERGKEFLRTNYLRQIVVSFSYAIKVQRDAGSEFWEGDLIQRTKLTCLRRYHRIILHAVALNQIREMDARQALAEVKRVLQAILREQLSGAEPGPGLGQTLFPGSTTM